MTKEIKVTGHIPMSVRKQVKKNKKTRTRKTLKHKRIKKIRTPMKQDAIPTMTTKSSLNSSSSQSNSIKPIVYKNNLQKSGNTKSILQMGKGRTKNKTVKKVRFNLESQGVQTGKFRNAQRVKMKTAKRNQVNHRFKNRTLKNKKFKIRFSDDQIGTGISKTETDYTNTGDNSKNTEESDTNSKLDLVTSLKDFNERESTDISITRVF